MMQCILSCQIMQQRTTLDLSDRLMDMSSVDFSKCEAVYEDGSYEIYFQSDKYRKNDIESVDVCVNGERVGSIALDPDTETVEGYTKYNDSLFASNRCHGIFKIELHHSSFFLYSPSSLAIKRSICASNMGATAN